MDKFPAEFAACLTDAGRQLLQDGLTENLSQTPNNSFISINAAIEPRFCRDAYHLLNANLYAHLSKFEQPIPPFSTWNMVENYRERLPKVVRMKTIDMAAYNQAYQAVKDTGLLQMLNSESFHQFVTKLSGYRLRQNRGQQVLCYEKGDYIGPHNDHHPEEAAASDGYVDCHISFIGTGVEHQYLVYEQDRHLTQIQPVHQSGLITVYRLPFWHYTTPMAVQEKALAEQKRRWVLLGTFLFDRRDPVVKKWRKQLNQYKVG